VIAVEASPVNQYDLMMISGNYGYRPHLPAIMGTEGVGRPIAVGNAANDAVEQALSKTSLAELVRGVG
jgi:NADPH:quinone reductase-like Zn-dependent oxidoreductase